MTLQPDDPTQAQVWIRGTAPDQIVDFYVPRGNQGEMGPRGPIGPSLAVGLVETSTGPVAQGLTGATGLTGPKGDPGGFTAATSLGTADLNSITADGLYRQNTTANATLAANYPVTNTVGLLYVNQSSTSSYMQQIFYPGSTSNSRTHYIRVNSGGTWTPWRSFASTRVDQTAGRAIYQWDDVNGREQLIWGDTGSRVINDLVDATKFTIAVAKIRRVGSQVELRLSLTPLSGVSGNVQVLAGLPTGFRQQHTYNGFGADNANSPIMYSVAFAGGALVAYGVVASRGFGMNLNFQTYDPWPTTLPGTSDGTINNT